MKKSKKRQLISPSAKKLTTLSANSVNFSYRKLLGPSGVASRACFLEWVSPRSIFRLPGVPPSSLWRLLGVSGGRLGASGRRFGAPGAVLGRLSALWRSHLELWWRSGVPIGGRRVVIGVALGGRGPPRATRGAPGDVI